MKRQEREFWLLVRIWGPKIIYTNASQRSQEH